MTKTLALLGDSIIDNQSYVGFEPDTHSHVVRLLGPEWAVELHAVDGAVMSSVHRQLRDLRGSYDAAVLSVGGNDALAHLSLLDESASSAAEVLETLGEIASSFARDYEALVDALRPAVERLVLCTIYEPPMFDELSQRLAGVVLSLLNDHIIQTATSGGLDVIDLRFVCTDESDFIMAIEPSATGAEKIGAAIARVVGSPDTALGSRVFTT